MGITKTLPKAFIQTHSEPVALKSGSALDTCLAAKVLATKEERELFFAKEFEETTCNPVAVVAATAAVTGALAQAVQAHHAVNRRGLNIDANHEIGISGLNISGLSVHDLIALRSKMI